MGLGGGRKRVKIGHDPNNETWARQTTNYGHRMLVSQGWAPGKVLGSSDSSYYSKHHLTEGSHSHIRVSIREDNLGLGAKRGAGQEAGECVGLDAFQGLLGRLNGKSDEVLAKEQQSRDDMKRARYVEQRGTVRFVQAGTLISDMDELIELARQSRISMGFESDETASGPKSKKSKKSKQSADEEADRTKPEGDSKTIKKSKKRRLKETEQEDDDQAGSLDDSDEKTNSGDRPSKAQRKAEKQEKRDRKQRRREEKAARKAEAAAATVAAAEIVAAPANTAVKEIVVVEEPAERALPAAQSRQEAVAGRHTSVRSRYIAAKRRAVMDPQALKEILMVKV